MSTAKCSLKHIHKSRKMKRCDIIILGNIRLINFRGHCKIYDKDKSLVLLLYHKFCENLQGTHHNTLRVSEASKITSTGSLASISDLGASKISLLLVHGNLTHFCGAWRNGTGQIESFSLSIIHKASLIPCNNTEYQLAL